jgi:hypothetical protein
MRFMILSALIFFTVNSFCQGFNNNNPVDQEDMKFLFELNKVQPFKFSFHSTSDSSVNIIIEEYNHGMLTNEKNVFADFKPMIAMGDEPFDYYFPKLNDKKKHWIRFYLDEKNKDTTRLWYKTETLGKRFSFNINGISLTQVRGFDNIPQKLIKRQTLFVYYGNSGGMMISCPGNAQVKDIVAMYDFVLAVYAEPFKINK